MRRRKTSKPDAVVQVNLRIDEPLRRQLEAAAKEHHLTFSQEVRLRLTTSTQSLAGFMVDFERNVRDVVELNARNNSKDIEATFQPLADLRAHNAHYQTGVEKILFSFMRESPELRALVRGAPSLSHEKVDTTTRARRGGNK